VLGYVDRPGLLHTLSGTAKLVLVVGLVLGAMISFDPRYLAGLAVLSVILWALSRIRLADLKVVLWTVLVFMALNNLMIFLFAPGYGTDLFGTRHLLADGPGRWDLTSEQLYYQLVVTLKYFAVLPGTLLFITTTRPPEFASSLNRIGVPHKVAYSVSLAMRYIPDLQREFHVISQAQQARGLDTSSRARLSTRLRNVTRVLIPLLLGTLDRIEAVSSAMELRGFGRGKKRTWYGEEPLRARDVVTMLGALALVAVAVGLLAVNGGRYWNPFV
jgi:energy-coupling factor transport system permease protein